MRIIRYRDKQGGIAHAAQQSDGTALKLAGDIYHSPTLTNEKAEVAKLLGAFGVPGKMHRCVFTAGSRCGDDFYVCRLDGPAPLRGLSNRPRS